ncbi:MAG: polysaccharide deacetylase family protein [Bacteroidia bacterium]|nr:polysaccharide deacetylase family protein [Bacteroidia bacterium]
MAVITLLAAGCTKKSDFSIALDDSYNDPDPAAEVTILDPGVALTFDDASIDEWIEMLPILNKYNARVTFFISLYYPKYDPNCKNKVMTLYNAGNEIGIHTLNHPHLSTYLEKHSLNEYYNNEILPEVRFFNSLGINPGSFAYPYGEYNPKANRFLSQYFNKIRCIYGNPDINKVKKVIGASEIFSSTLKDYKEEILYAKLNSSIWVLVEHKPVQNVSGNDYFTFSLLDSICNFVSRQNMRFYCLREIDTAILEKQRIKD